jgi:hypothetical protein
MVKYCPYTSISIIEEIDNCSRFWVYICLCRGMIRKLVSEFHKDRECSGLVLVTAMYSIRWRSMEQEEGESESDQVEERAVGNHLPEAEHSGGGDCGEHSYAVDFSLSTCSQINSRWFLFKFATWQLVCIYQCGLGFFFEPSISPTFVFFFEPSISPILLRTCHDRVLRHLHWTPPPIFFQQNPFGIFFCRRSNDISSVKRKSNDRCQLVDPQCKHIRFSLIFFSNIW